MKTGDKIRISENNTNYYPYPPVYKVGFVGEVTSVNNFCFFVKFKDGNSYAFYTDDKCNEFIKYEKIDRNKNLKYLLENII